MADNPENFTQHFRDSWDQTVGAWVSIFKGVRGASKVAAKGTKETIAKNYEDSRAEAIINISKDLVKSTAHGGTAAVDLIVDKTKEVTGMGGKHKKDTRLDADKHGGMGYIAIAPHKVLIGLVICVVVAQTSYIVYLYNRAQTVDKPASKWPKPGNLRSKSPQPFPRTPSPQPVEVGVSDDVPLVDEEEDRRLAASEARYRKDMDMESLDSEEF
ncbi:hypothetical protein ABB37_05020 [Leptomonas pyrrhocoris]|uniref:Transmembrane protein n=1 Tax=Leptomonas pyrrhocoris TaxID=157538 RepID=A0A0M9G0L8_LEPPY|nr:hypothetical protein ABB37_05020 [Leptomonas pyrrhocoris]XP_015658419.1 hypothetical protein ABB37_05020 [Leptomonas pyrrhocoris]KPA79979.1 hypothetical protein ABB37_05020 [Leptomonas pyrrhocoris]KPA79980.1 hypothetical protein ABB37_05020 [Leptomonas pyrrhocoris]|eukprot:XP_015658418.1 hypothetical protein ABB37_05020 [Leptomonas pyrrhocoris]